MIIREVFGSDKGNGDNFAIRNSYTYIRLVVEIGHGRINQHNRCYNPYGVHENSSAGVDLSTHIVAKSFMDINEQSGYCISAQYHKILTSESDISMHWLILLTAGCLIVTKLADVLSTLRHIRDTQHESNPYARRIMQRIGQTPAVWLVFGLSLIIIGVATYVALSSHWLIQIAFIILGVFVSYVQAAVAHSNATQRDNTITRAIRQMLYRWYGRKR